MTLGLYMKQTQRRAGPAPLRSLVGVSVTVLVVSCSSSESSNVECEQLYTASIGRCPEVGPGLPAAREAFHVRYVNECAGGFALKGTSITPSEVAKCAAALSAASCGTPPGALPACASVAGTTPGTLAEKAPCIIDAQCASGYCGPPLSTVTDFTCGVCRPTLKVGDSCPGPAGPCPRAAPCTLDTSPQSTGGSTCKPFPYVNGTEISQPLPAVDEDCRSTLVCAAGLGCDQGSFTCVPLTGAGPGEVCTSSAGGPVACLVGDCPEPRVDALNAPVVCPGVVEDGEPCVATDATKTCRPPALCKAGKCLTTTTLACE